MGYLKHSNGNGNKPTKRKQTKPQPPSAPVKVVLTGPDAPGSLQHDINHVAGLAGIEQSLDWIARGLERITNDGTSISLCTARGTVPLKIALAENDEDDALADLTHAFQRIADSLAKLAGLNRPPLEPEWCRDPKCNDAVELTDKPEPTS